MEKPSNKPKTPHWRVNNMAKLLIEMASRITAAQASCTRMTAKEISNEVRYIYKILQELQTLEAELPTSKQEQISPPVRALNTIQRDQVICLECNKSFKQLSKRHLVLHGLTSRDYKVKYGLPLRQPLSAKSLSQLRRKIAKKKGLGAKLVDFRRRQMRQQHT
jgi:predicted transcriptional regulator